MSSNLQNSSPENNNLIATLPQLPSLTIQLDPDNYSFWRPQIMATVGAHSYEDILFCEAVPDEGTSTNSDCLLWHRRDQVLHSWMLSSIDETMLCYVSRCEHSFQVWKVFDNLFQLKALKKGALSLDDYVSQILSLADGLQEAGYSLSHEDLVMFILGGLGAEFDAVVVELLLRTEFPSATEVQAILHTHENLLLHGSHIQNITRADSRDNASFQGIENTQNQPTPNGGQFEANLVHQTQGSFSGDQSDNHTASDSHQISSSQSTSSSERFVENGSKHHDTSQLEKLHAQSPYTGKSSLTVCNGFSVPIKHVESMKVPSLLMDNVLHVPAITNNLMSISQFLMNSILTPVL